MKGLRSVLLLLDSSEIHKNKGGRCIVVHEVKIQTDPKGFPPRRFSLLFLYHLSLQSFRSQEKRVCF